MSGAMAVEMEEAPQGAALLTELPAAAQAAAYRRAAQAGISADREPELMKLLVTLEYYSYLTSRVPAELDEAGQAAAAAVAAAGREAAEALDQELGKAAVELGNAVVTAAGRAVQTSLKTVDLSPVLDRLAEHAEAAKRRSWLLTTVALSSLAIVGVAVAAGYTGWMLAEQDQTMISRMKATNHRYAQQMVCQQATPSHVDCRGPDGEGWRYTLVRTR